MKLELVCESGNGNCLLARDLIIKIDGRKMHGKINFFELSVPSPDSVIYWKMGLKEGKRIKFKKFKRFWRRFYLKWKTLLKKH